MQSKSKAKGNSESESLPNSPYRMGNWTVTMLKDELRVRQLPLSGKKAELIDRLESSSPVKLSPAPNTNSNTNNGSKSNNESKEVSSPLKIVSDSPKLVAAALKNVLTGEIRGRSRSRSSSPLSHKMMTRSRSNSLSNGTFFKWSSSPLSVISNFFMSLVDSVMSNIFYFAAMAVFFVSFSALLYFNTEYRGMFLDLLKGNFVQVFLDGFFSNLGFKRSGYRLYISRASNFMYDCSSGNIERNSSTGRLRCSASSLNFFDFGLPGRLFLLEKDQLFSWSLGTLSASILVFFLTRKSRTVLSLQINQNFRKILDFSNRFIYAISILIPFEFVGLISGLSGYNGSKFAILLIVKFLFGIPLQFFSRILVAKYQKEFESQISNLPENFISISNSIVNFLDSSNHLQSARQAFNAGFYLFLCAAAVQVIANNRLYKRNN